MSRASSSKIRRLGTLHLTSDLVAKTLRAVEAEGPEPNWTPISPGQLDELVRRVEKEAGDEEIWVFAYGSLMWNPGFDVAASEDAVAFGWQPSDKFTIWRKIRKVPRILVAAPGSRFADMQHPNELKPDDCLAYSGESRRENWVLSDGGSSMTISAGRAFSANSGEVLADMAADGAGVALLPGFNIADHIRAGRLVHAFKGWAPPDLWPPRIASFSKFFEKQVAAHMVMLD